MDGLISALCYKGAKLEILDSTAEQHNLVSNGPRTSAKAEPALEHVTEVEQTVSGVELSFTNALFPATSCTTGLHVHGPEHSQEAGLSLREVHVTLLDRVLQVASVEHSSTLLEELFDVSAALVVFHRLNRMVLRRRHMLVL